MHALQVAKGRTVKAAASVKAKKAEVVAAGDTARSSANTSDAALVTALRNQVRVPLSVVSPSQGPLFRDCWWVKEGIQTRRQCCLPARNYLVIPSIDCDGVKFIENRIIVAANGDRSSHAI